MQVQAPGELFKLWRAGKVPLLFVAYSWMLSQVADALGVQPGEEFRVALLEAQQVCHLCASGTDRLEACTHHTFVRMLTMFKDSRTPGCSCKLFSNAKYGH